MKDCTLAKDRMCVALVIRALPIDPAWFVMKGCTLARNPTRVPFVHRGFVIEAAWLFTKNVTLSTSLSMQKWFAKVCDTTNHSQLPQNEVSHYLLQGYKAALCIFTIV